jgi:CHASE3 domain sensor protein
MSAPTLPRSTSLLKIAWTVVPLVLIGCSAELTFRSQTALSDSMAALDQGFDMRQRIRQTYISLIDAETGQRGFLLTSKEAYLGPYQRALVRLPLQIGELSSMMADEPDQQKSLDQLQVMMKKKIGELSRTIAFAKAGDMAAALRLVNSDQGREDMDRIRMLVRTMTVACDRAVADRERAYTLESEANTRLALLLVVANGVFFAIAAAALWRIRKMEPLVTVCAWSRTIEYEGEWMSFEEYLGRRFDLRTTHGISPAEAERFKKSRQGTLTPPV